MAKSNAENKEFIELQEENAILEKELDILKNRKKNIHLVCDQVSGWSNKVQGKLNDSIGEHIPPSNQTMSEVFQNITGIVTK